MPLTSPHMQTVLRTISEGVFAVDENWHVTFMNSAAREMTGFNSDETTGRFCRSLFHADRCSQNCPLFRTLQEDNALCDEKVTITCRDGSTLPILVSTAALKDEQGNNIGGLVIFRDADTEKFRTEGNCEQAKLLKALNDAHWNRTRASQILGVSRTTLWRLMKRHDIAW